jgi:predicted dienelactone hydrolase
MTLLIRTFVFALVVASLSSCGDSQSVGSPDAPGPFAVGHASFTAADPTRNDRSLLVDAWYPVDAQDAQDSPLTEYPLLGPLALLSEVAVADLPVSARPGQTLLVFSHGYQSIHIQSFGLMEALASHGFIVISPEHTGNAQASPSDTFDEAAAKRVPDVSFLIDMMFDRNRDPDDPFYGRIDEESVGVVGHSFGAMTAIGMASGWADAEPDPRVTAIVPISAVIDGEMQSDEREGPNAGFTEEQLSSITVPVMLIGGTADVNVPIGNNEIAFEQLTNAPHVYKVDIIGATHTHFAAICPIGDGLIDFGWGPEVWPIVAEDLIEPYETTCGPAAFPIEEATRLQNLYVVAFFKRHMLNRIGYDRYLTTDFASTESAITFSLR